MSISFKYYLFLGIVLFSLCYSLLYILRDCYFATQNFQMKKYINKLLPFFTKYNKLFLLVSLLLLFLFFNFYNMYITKLYFFIIIMIIVSSFVFIYIPKRKLTSTKYLKFLSYILFIFVLLIPIF